MCFSNDDYSLYFSKIFLQPRRARNTFKNKGKAWFTAPQGGWKYFIKSFYGPAGLGIPLKPMEKHGFRPAGRLGIFDKKSLRPRRARDTFKTKGKAWFPAPQGGSKIFYKRIWRPHRARNTLKTKGKAWFPAPQGGWGYFIKYFRWIF